jgi:signal transduction histidine kinase
LDFGTLSLQTLEPCELVQRAIERAGLEPTVYRNEAAAAKIKGDPTLLDRAFGNMLENAQKHAGGVESVCLSKLNHKVCLTVNDRGPGFPSQALGRVFDAFYRGDGSSSLGLGLGLALVERIARAHGGRAWAENRPDGGASVHFEIPEV